MPAPPASQLSPGLSVAEAASRLAEDGPNELPGSHGRSLIRIVIEVMQEPMLLLLLAAGFIYLVLGEMHDAVILMAFAGLTIVIAIVQETRTEHAIEALRDLTAPTVIVVREGRRCSIPSREVVHGDLVVLVEGGRIAADGWLVDAQSLEVDEATLTGESVPVGKSAVLGEPPADRPVPGGNGVPFVWSGTLVVRGSGLLRVVSTGAQTRIGQIGQSLSSLETEAPRLSVQTRMLVRWFAAAGIAISILAVVLYRLFRGGWLDAMLSGIALAMSLLPEELPVVLTLFMTMGALRMSRSRVLARRGTAIETLGAATVLCTDKTGTLTQNSMQIAELRLPDGRNCRPDQGAALPDGFTHLARTGILACPADPFDPMEKAFFALADLQPGLLLNNHAEIGWTMLHRYALAPELLAVTQVWSDGRADRKVVAAKGAPEAIAQLCGLDQAGRQAMERHAGEMAASGLRVLGVAEASWPDGDLPEDQRQFSFAFVGLVGLADPLRPTVPPAVRALQTAGIRVVMITGDYPATARAIAGQAGMAAGDVLTGEELERLDDGELARRIGSVAIFARTMPEHKLRIVCALKSAGEVVAMTGDGVNDAPSLKAAHIGIAMGQRGTDVAREASSIVLLDDDFGTIVTAVRLGRRIYDNIRKAMGFIFAVHLPIAGLAIAPLLTGWPVILGPVHIALLEMIIDPVCSLAFEAEPEEADVLRRGPRNPESPLVSRNLLGWATVQGLLAILVLVGIAAWADRQGVSDQVFRATCFAALVATVVVLVFANRSFRRVRIGRAKAHNVALGIILAVVGTFFSLVFVVPQVAGLFRFAVLDTHALTAVAIMAGVLAIVLAVAKSGFKDRFIS